MLLWRKSINSFIYAFYLRMKKYYPKVRIDLSDMMHYKVHYGYEMLSGHNRQNAAKLAGLKVIPAFVKVDLPDEDAENTHTNNNSVTEGTDNADK